MEEAIRFYHGLGFQQSEILVALALHHDVVISERTLRRRLRELNLFRRSNFSDVFTVARFIEQNIRLHGQLHGYRWMFLKCLQNKLVVTQELVRQLLQIIDPNGVDIRRRRRLRRRQYSNKGPNFLWHVDCYDKLKPFGICISGCIDGFSRNIVWLRAGRNTNDPRIICGFYLEAIKVIGGCPRTVRSDMGTENRIMEQVQVFLRENCTRPSRAPPFLYGTSPSNQRIEAWWAILRKHHAQFWMNLFQKLREDGLFSGSFLDKSLIQFCFLKIIQSELDSVCNEWNLHRISSSRNSICPRGRPFVMYTMPQVYDTVDYVFKVTNEAIEACSEFCTFETSIPCDQEVCELALIIMNEEGLPMAEDPSSGLDLYLVLRNKLLDIL